MDWSYHSGYKWWEGSKGSGKFAVQKTKIGWLVLRVPWMGNPEVLSKHESKLAAMKHAEELA